MPKELYKSLNIESINSLTPTSFDMYAMFEGKYVKYAASGMVFTKSVIDGLLSSGVVKLYIKDNDFLAFNTYMRENLSAILADATTSHNKKMVALYGTATSIIEDMLQNPDTKQNVDSAKEVSNIFFNQVLSDNRSFASLLKVCSYDYYTYSHSVNVSIYTLELCKKLKLGSNDIKHIGQSAILHDIGKSKIDPAIINKQGLLTQEEFQKIKAHPQLGYEILKAQGEEDDRILSGVRHHHEKLDGTGYPSGKLDYEISLSARIITIADIFDALTTRRSYKPPLTSFQAFKMLKNMKNELDQKILDTFILCLKPN